ncbi:MAG: ABC transporter substrate-binding protein [Acidimicrobiales bacterium]
MKVKGAWKSVAGLAVLALVGSGCLGGDDDDAGGDGGTVTAFGTWTDAEAANFEASIAPFEEETGIDVQFEGDRDFNNLIFSRVQAGDPPDVAFPNPGVTADLVEIGEVRQLSDFLDVDALESSLIPGLIDAVTVDDVAYGVPVKANFKSIIWYNRPAFEAAAYQIPETADDLTALEQQIISDGGTPWCLGAESGAETGWPLTDWIEDYMLRLHGPDVYDEWVSHDLPFNSPQAAEAFEQLQTLVSTPGAILGGVQGVLSTNFGDSPLGLFADPPQCFMHRQADFITGFFPDDVRDDLDTNVLASYFPSGYQGGFDGDPVLGAGDFAVLLTENSAAEQFMDFLASDEFGGEWAAAGGFLSPHQGFDATQYPNEVTRQVAEVGAQADVLRFDASDRMPPAVAGAFQSAVVEFLSGGQTLDAALTAIDDQFPD